MDETGDHVAIEPWLNDGSISTGKVITAGYGRGKWGAWPELGLNIERTISRHSENTAEAATTSAARWLRHPANP